MTLIGVHETMCLVHPKCHVTDLLVVDLLGWKGSRTVRVACDEIAHSREFVYMRYFHAHGTPFYASAMHGARHSRTVHTSQCISPLCCASAG